MNASSPLYARGHCDGARLADLVEGDDDDARCGPWSRRRRGCAGGYYEDPADASADGAPLACPPGMFCPEGFTCFVACLYGAACAPSTYDADADACAWAVTLKHTPSSRGYRGGANVTCPGVMFETLVPAGFYAPDPTVDPRRCPAQHYCPTGSFEPTRCPFIARCGEEGLEAPDVSSAAAAAFLGSFFFFFMLYHSSRLVRAELRRFRERQRETLEAGLDAILDRRAAARVVAPRRGAAGRRRRRRPELGVDEPVRRRRRRPRDLPSLPRKAEAERIDVGFADLGLEVRAEGGASGSRCSSAARASSSGGPRPRAGDVAQIAGGGLGLLYVDFKFKNLQLVNFMVSIALGMTLTLAAVPTLARDRAVFLRECGDFGGGGLAPARTSSPTFAASGFGYVAAACLPPASAQLGALSVALLFAMFSGVHPTLAAMPAALKVVHYASHDRYFVEALFVEEVARMSEAFRLPPTFYADASSSALAQMLNYGYLVEDASVYWDHHKLRYINVATLLGLGAVARLLAFALLLRTNAAALGRPAPLAALCLRRRRGAPPPPPPRFAGAVAVPDV
ncbi:ATPase [Aureococcus anophagefferens]|nr:ATPase [Aureococcus anophagefferens]